MDLTLNMQFLIITNNHINVALANLHITEVN